MKTKYIADDGTEFDNAAECKAHEDGRWYVPLIGMSERQVADMIAGGDAVLQRALFDAYNEAKRIRREKGLVKPRKSTKAAEQAGMLS